MWVHLKPRVSYMTILQAYAAFIEEDLNSAIYASTLAEEVGHPVKVELCDNSTYKVHYSAEPEKEYGADCIVLEVPSLLEEEFNADSKLCNFEHARDYFEQDFYDYCGQAVKARREARKNA